MGERVKNEAQERRNAFPAVERSGQEGSSSDKKEPSRVPHALRWDLMLEVEGF